MAQADQDRYRKDMSLYNTPLPSEIPVPVVELPSLPTFTLEDSDEEDSDSESS